MQEIADSFTGWAFKAGKHRPGWDSLHSALCGSVAPCAIGVILRADLPASVDAGFGSAGPSLELRESADSLHKFQYSTSSIDAALGQIDPGVLRPVLQGVAQRLVPEHIENID